jgi:hypothetical protein
VPTGGVGSEFLLVVLAYTATLLIVLACTWQDNVNTHIYLCVRILRWRALCFRTSQRCTNPGHWVATIFFTVAPTFIDSSVSNLLHVTFLTHGILMWLLDLLKICGPLVYNILNISEGIYQRVTGVVSNITSTRNITTMKRINAYRFANQVHPATRSIGFYPCFTITL